MCHPEKSIFEENICYLPSQKNGFCAWATAFSYGNGTVGLSFDEVLSQPNPDYAPPSLELAEAAGVPVSYGSVECQNKNTVSMRVYMVSKDGLHFTETGRCRRKDGCLCCTGFSDGRILGFDVPRINPQGTGWGHCISVRESLDGGTTWTEKRRLLEGTAPYLWRVRKLRDQTIILLASLYGTPWGTDQIRPTRNTLLPDETPLSKIQTFFMTTRDGLHFSGPHYILPAIGAHEFDVAELPDGRLLFIAGDVQGTPVGRQFVTPSPDGFLNGPLLPIEKGTPADPEKDPQGGIVPESIVWDDSNGCLIGCRRNRPLTASSDFGKNWRIVSSPLSAVYQPFMQTLPDGSIGIYGHAGGDNAFGETDMQITAQKLIPVLSLPKVTALSLERMMNEDHSQYLNCFRACLSEDGKPISGQKLIFRFRPFWDENGHVSTLSQKESPYQKEISTDENGCALCAAEAFDRIGDIHFAYHADVIFKGTENFSPCQGPVMTVLSLTPKRKTPFPYDAYFAGGTLYLSPDLKKTAPDLLNKLRQLEGKEYLPKNYLSSDEEEKLLSSGVVKRDENGQLFFIKSVHAPRILNEIKYMQSGDLYE